MNRWAVAPGGCKPGVKELALVIVAVEWVCLNGQVMFPRSMLALPHAWRDWLQLPSVKELTDRLE
jgi:hypothetical protein